MESELVDKKRDKKYLEKLEQAVDLAETNEEIPKMTPKGMVRWIVASIKLVKSITIIVLIATCDQNITPIFL